MSQAFISRQPIINRQSKIVAMRLKLNFSAEAKAQGVEKTLSELVEFWPGSEKLVFVHTGQSEFNAHFLHCSLPENTIIELSSADFSSERATSLLTTLQEMEPPPSLCLQMSEASATPFEKNLSARFLGFDAARFSAPQFLVWAAQQPSHGLGVAFNVPDQASFDALLKAGVSAAASWFFMRPAMSRTAKALSSSQAHIIQVINLVRKNADIAVIEAALKSDVALSYKLLRYINSAGFGLSCEVQSFRHAVALLGYKTLNKWLSLLLATASDDPMAPALMHTALTRARLIELIAHDLVDRSEHDNLFIVGAFSLLDVLLGVSMEKILEPMSLPESIGDALLGRGGPYAPFLELAKASEAEDGLALAEQAGMLGLSAEHFNKAQMQALSFAESMSS